jgi:hypothetical protein
LKNEGNELQGVPGMEHDLQPFMEREADMLWTIFVILLVLWLLGLVTSYTLHGFIYILLVAALVILVLQLIGGRRAV